MPKRMLFVLFFLCSLIVLFDQCVPEPKRTNDFRGEAYAGSATCIDCHKEIAQSYLTSAHNLTSLPASKNSIKGSFASGHNKLYYRPALKVEMQQKDTSFYQVVYVDGVPKQYARFDIVIGSGAKGQSYLYSFKDLIFQLPVSYNVPGNSWVNSPSFPPKNVQFTRNIPIGCFECHSSYINRTGVSADGDFLVDHFDKKKLIYGIDCERCHGPAAEHVKYQYDHPDDHTSRFITNIASLPQQAKLDMCAMCHSGARDVINTTFTFQPGKSITEYLSHDTTTKDINQIDVHGKQYQLLTTSKCFLRGNALTCSSCHNTHRTERNNLVSFSAKCITCHKSSDHAAVEMSEAVRTTLASNCIDCHMPAKPSAIITMQSQENITPSPAMVRTHHIGIYEEETKKYLLKK